jgi:acyl transferase domain-containing protein/acyl carrier protein
MKDEWLQGVVSKPLGYFETIQRWTQFLDPRLAVLLHIPTGINEAISPLALLMRAIHKQQRKINVSPKWFLGFDVERRDRRQCVSRMIAQLYTAGLDINWMHYYHSSSVTPLSTLRLDSRLPTYPFQHNKSFWFDGKVEFEKPPASSIPIYEMSWVLNPTPVFPGFLLMLFAQVVFVIFSDSLGIAEAIKSSLAPSRVIMIFEGTNYSENRNTNHIFMDWDDETSYDNLLDSDMVFQPKNKKHYVVIDFRSLTPPENGDYAESAKRKCLQLSYLLRLVDKIIPSKHLTPLYEKKLFIITKQVHVIAGHQHGPLSLDQASIWGLCNSAALEYPGLDLLRIDIDTSDSSQYQHQLKLEIISSLKFASLEDRIAYRDGRRYTQRLKRETLASVVSGSTIVLEDEESLLSPEKTYLITGAFGGLGWSFTRWMVKMGARHLILLGRKLPSNGNGATSPILSELQYLKRIANVVVLEVDVLNRTELIQKLQGRHVAYNMPEIAGVIHSAGAIRDALLRQVPKVDEYYQACFSAKVRGAMNVHDAVRLQGNPIEFFLAFSSSACWLGSVGQCNYSAANMFMDTWVQDLRFNHNVPALAINWGPWDLGMTTKLHPRTLESLQEKFSLVTEKIGQAALENIFRYGPSAFPPSVGLFNMLSWDTTKPFYSELSVEDVNKSLLLYDQPSRIKPKESTTNTTKLTGVNIYQSLQFNSRDSNEVLKHVAFAIKDILGLSNSTESFDPDRLLISYGFDSLMAIELSQRLSITTKQHLSPGLVYDYPTAAKITAYLLRSMSEITFSKELSPKIPTSSVAALKGANGNDLKVAIIGVSCRLPGGANDLSSLWELMSSKSDGIGEAPETRRQEYYGIDGVEGAKMASKLGGFIRDVETFDASFFKISKQEAVLLDPQHRLLLEVSYSALENAGKGDFTQLAGSKTGVFIGVGGRDYEWLLRRHQPTAVDSGYFLTGNSSSCAVGRLSFFYGFTGPAISVDTACSSSLVSLHLASKALLAGECDMALAGGVNIILNSDYTVSLSRMGVLSPDGRCKSYSSSANGYVRSEGCGVFVLKRLSDALRDHDDILTVIRGSAINQDGNSNGLTAPNGPAQERVIRAALDDAQLQAKDISYVEGHGSSTPIGDAIELKALRSAFSTTQRSQPLILSSIKAKVGHLETAAGAAGLLSAMLVLRHQTVPPLLHYSPPSGDQITDVKFPAITSLPLPVQSQFVGVSSFGISGTNSHVILEAAPKVKSKKQMSTSASSRPSFIITLSGQDKFTLQTLLQQLLHKLKFLASSSKSESTPTATPEDMEATFNGRRMLLSHRIAITFHDIKSLTHILEDACAGILDGPEIYYGVTSTSPSVSFVLSYSISTPNSREYRERLLRIAAIQIETLRTFILPELLETLCECFRILGSLLTPFSDLNTDIGFFFQYTSALQDVIRREKSGEPNDATEFVLRFVFCEVTFFAISVCLSELLIKWGVVPAAAIGFGVGEYVAAHLAGVISLADVMKLLIARAQDTASVLYELVPKGQGLPAPHFSKAISQVNLNKYSRFPLLPSRNAIFSSSHWVSNWNKDLELAFDGNEEQLKQTLKQRIAPALQGAACILEIIPHDSCSPSNGVIEEVVSANDQVVYHRSPCVRRVERMKKENEATLEVAKHYFKELLNTVAYFHVFGHVSINWQAFSSSFPGKGVFSTELAIPYPFQRCRYWPTEDPSLPNPSFLPSSPSFTPASNSSTTPSSSRRVHQPSVRDLFEFDTISEHNKELSVSVSFNQPLLFQIVRDHNLHGIIVVPAAFYVSLAIDGLFAFIARQQQTLNNLLKSRIHSISIQEMQFHQVLLLSEEEFTAGTCPTLKLLLINNTEEINNSEFRYQFEFSSHQKKERGGTATHCTGSISIKSISTVSSVQLPSSLQDSSRLGLREFYSLYESIEYLLGPSFRWVQSVVMGGANAEESLAHLNTPSDCSNTSFFILHPGLIDSFFQSVNLGASTVTSAPYIPARIESATIFLPSRDTFLRPENWKPDRNIKVHSETKRQTVEERTETEAPVTSTIVFQNSDLVGNLKVSFIRAGQRALNRALIKQMGAHCYELTWQPSLHDSFQTTSSLQSFNSSRDPETVIVISECPEILGKIRTSLLAKSVSVKPILLCWNSLPQTVDEMYTLDLGSSTVAESFRNLLFPLRNGTQNCCLLFLFDSNNCSLTQEPTTVFETMMKRYSMFSDLLKCLVEEVSLASKVKITLVTSNINLILEGTTPSTSTETTVNRVNVVDSPLCGLFSVFAAETSFSCQLFDISDFSEASTLAWLVREILDPLQNDSNIAYRNGRRYTKKLTRSTQLTPYSQLRVSSQKGLFRPDGCYLISGGLGGIAQTLINYLVDNGAGGILLMGRRPLPPDFYLTWASNRGCRLHYLQGDVSNRDSVREAIRVASKELNLPLRGVFHCAGILDDALLIRLDTKRMVSVMKPKILGALNLHFETLSLQLDQFVLFSSVASILGSSGQSSYVAANCFLDALSHARRAAGLPSMSQNWGPWSLGLGSGAAEKKWKLSTISRLVPLQGYAAFDILFGSQHQPHKFSPAQLSVISVGSWDSFLSSQNPSVADFHHSLLSELLDQGSKASRPPGASRQPTQTSNYTPREIEERVKRLIAEAVNLPESSIRDDHLIEELGIDSMLSIDLRNLFSIICLNTPVPVVVPPKTISPMY